MQYVQMVCGKMYLHTEISRIPWGKEIVLETFFRLILSEKILFPMKTIHHLSISEVKLLLVNGNI